MEYDQETDKLCIKGYAPSKTGEFSHKEKRNVYMAEAVNCSDIPDRERAQVSSYLMGAFRNTEKILDEKPKVQVLAGKKYKPVALKTRPVYAELPESYRIKRDIRGDPLENMPKLNPQPPEFEPTGRYTQERKDQFDEIHRGDFLWPEEKKLMHHIVMEQNEAFAWDNTERGRFREDFFPPIVIPAVEHSPWVYRNIPIPSGIYEDVCKMVKKKIEAGVYEPSNASYRSR